MVWALISKPEDRSLDDYLAFFKKAIRIDVLIAVVIGMSTALQAYVFYKIGEMTRRNILTRRDILTMSVASGAVAMLFVDALLVAYFMHLVKALVDQADSMNRLIFWKRICVANSSVALMVYIGHLILEIALPMEISMPGDPHARVSDNSSTYAVVVKYAGMAVIFIYKPMRILAFNTFSKWLRHRWQQGATAVVTPTPVEALGDLEAQPPSAQPLRNTIAVNAGQVPLTAATA